MMVGTAEAGGVVVRAAGAVEVGEVVAGGEVGVVEARWRRAARWAQWRWAGRRRALRRQGLGFGRLGISPLPTGEEDKAMGWFWVERAGVGVGPLCQRAGWGGSGSEKFV